MWKAICRSFLIGVMLCGAKKIPGLAGDNLTTGEAWHYGRENRNAIALSLNLSVLATTFGIYPQED